MRILKVKLEMMPKHLRHPIAPTVLVITNQADFASMPMLAHAVMFVKGKTHAYDIWYSSLHFRHHRNSTTVSRRSLFRAMVQWDCIDSIKQFRSLVNQPYFVGNTSGNTCTTLPAARNVLT